MPCLQTRYQPGYTFCNLHIRPTSRSRQAAAIVHMLLNNLDPAVAQFPQELVTYGGNGQVLVTLRIICSSCLPHPSPQVLSNWAQFRLVLHYLSTMTDQQTLVLYSGHPMGIFPSSAGSPRAVITNGMVSHSSSPTCYTCFPYTRPRTSPR